MARNFTAVDWKEFSSLVEAFPFQRRITEVHLHHTWRPRQSDYRGQATIQGMWRYHTQDRGWSDIAQHVTVAPDGAIWICRNFNWAPASAVGFNGNSASGPFMIEMIGDFDLGQEDITKKQKEATLAVIKSIQTKFGLGQRALGFHNEMSTKTCPGETIDKDQWIKDVRNFSLGDTKGRSRSSPFDRDASRAWQLIRALSPDEPQPDFDSIVSADHPVGFETLEERGQTDRGARGPALSDDMIAELADHVVNLEMGQFSSSGEISTDQGDVDRIFDELLPAEVAKTGGNARLLFYAHGGLVSESNALAGAFKQLKFWRANGIYPIFFIWETGFAETISQLLGASSRRMVGPRGERAFGPGDFLIEELARALKGGMLWGGMKRSAELASAAGGGATYVAGRAAAFLKNNQNDVEIHTAGHSAGAIFQANFMPRLVNEGGEVKTAHFMAPAVRNDAFHDLVSPLLGKGIGPLSVFTMRKQLERNDNVAVLYRKSLLYLIHRALEPERGEPILGLEVSLRDDQKAKKIFGLTGTQSKLGDVVWSKAGDIDGGNASDATTHGGFDDDPATMESIARRILDRRNGEPVAPFPPLSRDFPGADFWEGQVDLPEGLEEFFAFPVPPSAPPELAGAVGQQPGSPPPAASDGIRRRLALCIGIDNYRHISGLSGCINDAKLWQRTLAGLGYQTTRLDDPEAAAIRDAVGRMIADAGDGDSLVLQFSGHGTQFEDTDGDEAQGDTPGLDECFCAVDCGAGSDGLVIDDEFRAMFAKLPEGAHLTSFFDCCHSGTMNRAALRLHRSRAGSGRRPRFVAPNAAMRQAYQGRLAATRALRGALPPDSRDVQFSACRSDELAYENNGQGDFTRHACGLLAASGWPGISNSQFRDRVIEAFGPATMQNPNVHCAGPFLSMRFLQLRA